MKKKIVNVVLFLAVLAAALGMTFYVGNNAMSVLLYNFVFLGIIAVVYVVGLFGRNVPDEQTCTVAWRCGTGTGRYVQDAGKSCSGQD